MQLMITFSMCNYIWCVTNVPFSAIRTGCGAMKWHRRSASGHKHRLLRPKSCRNLAWSRPLPSLLQELRWRPQQRHWSALPREPPKTSDHEWTCISDRHYLYETDIITCILHLLYSVITSHCIIVKECLCKAFLISFCHSGRIYEILEYPVYCSFHYSPCES